MRIYEHGSQHQEEEEEIIQIKCESVVTLRIGSLLFVVAVMTLSVLCDDVGLFEEHRSSSRVYRTFSA